MLGKREKRELASLDLYMEVSKLYLGNLNSRFALEEIVLELPILQVLESKDGIK